MSSRVENIGLQESTAKAPDILFLDLSKTRYQSRDDLQNALWKIPDLRMRHDRIWDEEVLCRFPRKSAAFPFPSPVPASLSTVRIQDLSQVDIDWRMMTLLRPKTKLEEDIFTRLIQLDRLTRQSTENEIIPPNLRLGVPRTSRAKVVKSRSSSHAPSSPRSKHHQEIRSDDDDEEESKPQPGRLSYEFYIREPPNENEEKDLSELTSFVGEKALDNKKHKHSGRKNVQDNADKNINKEGSEDVRKSKLVKSKAEVPGNLVEGGRKSKFANNKVNKHEGTEEVKRDVRKNKPSKDIDIKQWLNEVVDDECKEGNNGPNSKKKSKRVKQKVFEVEDDEIKSFVSDADEGDKKKLKHRTETFKEHVPSPQKKKDPGKKNSNKK